MYVCMYVLLLRSTVCRFVCRLATACCVCQRCVASTAQGLLRRLQGVCTEALSAVRGMGLGRGGFWGLYVRERKVLDGQYDREDSRKVNVMIW